MLKWLPFPVVRVALAFIAGILLALNWGEKLFIPAWFYVGAFLLFVAAWVWAGRQRSPVLFSVAGSLAMLCFLLAGFRITQLRPERTDPKHLSNQSGGISHYIGFIDDFPVNKPRFYQATLRVQKIKKNGTWKAAKGLVAITIRKIPGKPLPEYGQVLLIKGEPRPYNPPLNPNQFDFRKYQAARNIFLQQFLSPNQYRFIGRNAPSLLLELSIKARSRMEKIFRKLVPAQREFGIASALVLGIKDELDNDIKATYSNTGTMHVLAVSGLHVGLVFGLLNIGLKRLRKTRFNRLLAAILMLSIIWAFAFITALSASVLRAAVMFTFVVVAQLLQKRTNIYNTLAAAALTLLVINPYFLLDVGFQLSFVAVLSIVYLQPIIYRWFAFGNYLADKIWGLIAISLAAQIGTIGLSLFYFHQFPVYFLLTNLIAVPLSTLILYQGLALLAFCWVPYLNVALGLFMQGSLWLMNESMRYLENWPGAIINRIPFSGLQTVLFYLALLLFLLFLKNYKLKVLSSAVMLLAVVVLLHFQTTFAVASQRKLVIFAVPGKPVWGVFENGSALLFADAAFSQNKAAITFNLEPAFLQNQTRTQQIIAWQKATKYMRQVAGKTVFVWRGNSFLMLQKPLRRDLARPVPIDYLVLQNNVWVKPEKLRQNFRLRKVILDSSNAAWYRKWLIPKLQASGLSVYDVNASGAFVLVQEKEG